MTPSQAEAERRIRSALKRIEHAQNEINEACSEIASVVGLVDEWEAGGELADDAKAYWHALNSAFQNSRGDWDLDEMSREALEKKASGA